MQTSLDALGIDVSGIDQQDRLYLETLIQKFSGGPVGVDTLSASMSEESETLEDVIEPYLLQKGFIDRTAKGRVATHLAYEYLGIDAAPASLNQQPLF